MSCKIIFKDGKINGVETPNGKASKLFVSIAANPHIKSLNEALDIYKNIFLEKFQPKTEYGTLSPDNSSNFANMTEDGQGNFVFYHYSQEEREFIDPTKYGSNIITSKEEAASLSRVGGVSMFYVNNTTAEPGVGSVKHMIKVPVNKVYDFNSDVDGLLEQAKEDFNKDFPGAAFSVNTQLAYMTKVASQKGYSMIVAEWRDGNSRAQSVENLYPVDTQIASGNTIVKPFKNDYKSNLKKGYKSIIPETQEDQLAALYLEIHKERNKANKYDSLYRLYTDYSKLSQHEIASLIENSDISQELKDEYSDIINSEEGQGRSSILDKEPELTYRTPSGVSYNTFKEALLNTNEGVIEGVIEGVKLFEVDSNTNVNTVGGFINSYIKSGLMSDEKIIENGESFLQSAGKTDEVRTVNEFIIEKDAKLNLGTANVSITKDGKISLLDMKGKVEMTDGSVKSISDFDSMSKEEVKSQYPEESNMILAARAVKEMILDNTYGAPTSGQVQIKLSEKELRIRLLGLLEKMGVKVTTIEEYVKNYKIRNGVEPTANALADIGRQVIALRDFNDTDGLLEETAHFIVEAWSEEDITNLLDSMGKTEEYKEHSEFYRELYSKQLESAEEVEKLVRKEVLAKILAKSISDNFTSETLDSNIIDYIKNLFSEFINKVRQYFSTQDEVNLNNFLNQAQDLLLRQDVNNYLTLQNLNNKKFVMFQAAPTSGSSSIDLLIKQSKTLLQVLQQQEKDLLKANKGLKSNVKKLKALEQQIDTAVVKDSILELLSTAKRQAKYISQAADVATRNGKFLSNEEGIVNYSLKNTMFPLLSEIKDFLVKENNTENKPTIKEIDEVIIEVSDIIGKTKNQDNKVLSTIIDRMMARHNFDPEVRDTLEKATKAALNDTTAFYATFGQLSHARDPILNMAGTIIHDLTFEANVNFLRPTKKFQKVIEDLGYTEKDLRQFFDNGYIVDIRDWNAFEEKELDISSNILKNVSGTTLTIEEIKDLKRDAKSHKGLKLPELDANQNLEYKKEYRAQMSPYLETVFTEQYYKDEEAKYSNYNISDLTIKERKDLSTDRGDLLSRVKDASGKVRFTNKDKIDLNALNIKRKKLKSLYNEFGLNKTGLTITPGTLTEKVSKSNPDIIEVNGNIVEIDKSVATNEAIVAFDLNKLDILYQQEGRDNPNSLSQEFLDEVANIEANEGRDEALEFFRLNSFINFSEEYWNSLDSSNGLISRLESVAGTEELIERLNKHTTKRKQIIKQYQSQQDASNILVSDMPAEVKAEVLELTDSIDRMFLEASRFLMDNRSDDEVSMSENTPNESYYNETQGMSTQEKIQFILDNTTSTNKRRILDFGYALDDLNNKGKQLSKGKQSILDRFDTGDTQDTILKYAETRLAPYYTRFAPKGFSIYQNRLENSAESVYEVVSDMNNDSLLQITNNYSYYKAEDNKYSNVNYKNDFEGGFFQPKISEFKNQKFEDMFAPIIQNGEVVSVGKNENLYKLYTEMLNYQRGSLKALGEDGSHNLWKAPQISKTGLNKFTDFIKKKDKKGTFLESMRDALFYRVDDQAYGAEIDGDSVIKTVGARYIPKYYLKNLEKKTDVSEDLFYSMTAFAQQAHLYESRKNAFSDMMAIQESLLSRQYPEGKSAEASSTVKMFKSYMDAYLFGVKESKQLRVTLPVIGQVDLTKNIRFLHSWVLNRNLGFNAIVPFTSWVTAESQTVIEKYIKEYINPYSTGLATVEFSKLSTDAIKDTLEVNSEAKLNVMGEHFGIYDLEKRFENSIYSKTLRNIPKIGMALNQAANFPIIPRVMLTVLYDFRVYGGDVVNFNQFKKLKQAEGVTEKDLIVDWKNLEDKALYNYMNVSTIDVSYDLKRLQADTGSTLSEEDFAAYMNEKEKAVTSRIREVVKFVDGQIPAYEKSAAQRHFFLSFFTTHRGWLAIAYARRFKNKHINFQTGQEEQGSYRSLANFLGNSLSGLYKGGFKDFIKNAKDDWNNSDDIQKANMKRVMIELAFLQGIVGIGWLIGQMADDDENKDLYALQLTNYLYFRLMNESTSSQTAIGGQFYDLVKSPIVGADTVKSIFSITEYYNTDEIKTGRYAGMEKWQKQLMSVIPGLKSGYDLAEPKSAYDSYRHFNPDVEMYNPIWWILETNE